MIKQSKMHQRVMRASGAMLALSAVLPFAPAVAQTAAPAQDAPAIAAAAPADASPQLETVTVTAQRRTENIKDVPISVTTLRAEKLDVLVSGGQDIRVLAGKVPSLNIESSNGRTFPRFYIRGYGNTDFSTFASQPVSLIYDDVVQENGILKGFPMFDLANVEVLRGPQGTLFGRNTPAGVVKFESEKPKLGKMEGYYNLSAGTHNTDNVDGAINIPLSDQWAMRVSTLRQHRDDYVTNLHDGKQYDGYNEHAERVQLLYAPNADFNALLNVHQRTTDGSARLFRANLIQKGTNDFSAGYSDSTVNFDGQNYQELHTYGSNLRLSWDLGSVKLFSVTGYEKVANYLSRGDIDGGVSGAGSTNPVPFPVETGGGLSDLKQYSQEFRVESKNAGPLNWQTGVYYFDEDANGYSNNYANVTGVQTSHLASEQKNTAWAAFGSVNYAVSDAFTVRGGLRYTKDKKDFDTVSAIPATQLQPTSASESKNKVNWDLSGTYKLNQQVNVYGRIATGFRAPSIAAATASVPVTVADAETITSYEAGIKTDLFDRRARASLSVYDFTVKNQQLTVVGGQSNSTQLINAARSKGRGVETDFEGFITPQFKVTAGGSYNFTKIEDPNLFVGNCGQCTITDPKVVTASGATLYSINGNALPQAPRWIANATARYGFPVADGEVFVYTDWSYRSKVNFFLYESTEFTGRALLEGGLRVGYNWAGGKYEVAAYSRNITNTQRITGAIDFNNLTGFTNDPRMFGLQFKALF